MDVLLDVLLEILLDPFVMKCPFMMLETSGPAFAGETTGGTVEAAGNGAD